MFGVESPDIGELTKIRIGHDGTGFGSGWFLEKVISFISFLFLTIWFQVYIKNPLSSQQWVLLCGKWLDKGEADGKIIRELVPTVDGVASQPCTNYNFLYTFFFFLFRCSNVLNRREIQSTSKDRRHTRGRNRRKRLLATLWSQRRHRRMQT